MLPGFRFLFAATVLSMSILIFGVGAAALLRAAHEEIASTPSRRAGPEPKFAQPSEVAEPVLALLRIEPAPAEPKATDNAPAAMEPAAPTETVVTPAEPDKVATLKSDDASPAETAKSPETPKPEIAASDIPAKQDVAAARAEAPTAEPTKMAAIAEVMPTASQAVAPAAEEAGAPLSTEADLASTASMKIATLGGPPVSIEAPPAIKASAKSDPTAAKKRLQAKRAAERRRLAQRARQAAPQAAAADPFAQPAITTRSR